MVKLRATITPHNCPFIDKPVNVMNKKTVAILGGTITFYVTPQTVVAVRKVVDLKDWSNLSKTYQTSAHEIKAQIFETFD